MRQIGFRCISIVLLFILYSCSEQREPALFEFLDAWQTNIDFENTFTETEGLDIFMYRNYYNGAGVGIADLTGNGYPDIYLVSNQGPNRFYKNHGDFYFEDITEQAGVAGSRPWSAGVAIANVNGNGLLDNYVINAGNVSLEERANELFINNGDGTFAEMAAGFQDYVYTYKENGEFYPYHNRHDLSDQTEFINSRFPTHKEYSDIPMNRISTSDELSSSRTLNTWLLGKMTMKLKSMHMSKFE